MKICTLIFIFSLSTSFLQSDCFDPSAIELGSSFSTLEKKNEKWIVKFVSSFRQKLIDNGVQVAQVVASKAFVTKHQICFASSTNVFELPLKHAIFSAKVEEAYNNLVDKLIELGEFREYSICNTSFMFEPSTNKIVFEMC